MPPRRSQSAGRKSAAARPSASRTPATPRGSTKAAAGGSTVLSTSNGAATVDEMRQMEAFLSGRARAPPGAGSGVAKPRGWGFWAAIIALEVVAFLWLRWAVEVYAEMRAKYQK